MEITEYLQKYYDSRLLELSKELGDFFKSTENRGLNNSKRFTQRLIEHLPEKYSYQSSSEIFDKEGEHTNSKDFVIYDRSKNINLISLNESNILPVDIVLGAFEMKTNLNNSELKRSFNQIREVKKLKFIQKKVKIAEYISDRLNDSTYETSPPLGIIVAYDHSFSNENFDANVITYSKEIPIPELWDMIYVINKGIFFINYLNKNGERKLIRYRNFKYDNETDIGASFLNFILVLNNKLESKLKTIPKVDFREEYNLKTWLWRLDAKSYDI